MNQITVPETLVPAGALAPASTNKSVLVEQAYQIYCDRTEAGERLDPDVYCAQFPALQSTLHRLVQAHRFAADVCAHLPDEQDVRWPQAGEAFLGFRLLRELGHGAFARVFLASEARLGHRLVAVKIARQGGRAEAQTLGRLKHPNIAPVYSVAENRAEGWTLVCMPYLGSATLHDVLDRAHENKALPTDARVFLEAANDLVHPLEPAAHPAKPDVILATGSYLDGVRWLGAQLADALAFIHGRGVCHLDLKPSNVLLSPDGTPLLLDFNLSSDSRYDHQRFGGTFPYMSPEQLRASDRHALPAAIAAVGAESDLFSLGVLLYELTTGAHPFGPIPLKMSRHDLRVLVLERQQAGFMPVRRVNADVDPAFADLIERCLENDPARRPQAADEIAAVLRRELQPMKRARRWVARHPRQTLAGMAFCALLGLMMAAAWGLAPPPSERDYAAGVAAYQRGNYEKARADLSGAIQADPKSAKAFFARGRAYQKIGLTDKTAFNQALDDFKAAQELNPDGRNLAAMGYCCQLSRDVRIALDLYQRAEKAGFANAGLYNNIAYCRSKVDKKPDQVRKYLDRAIATNARLGAAYHNRALLLALVAKNKMAAAQPGKPPPAPDLVGAEADLSLGLADIQMALALGPPSGELSFDAACFFAVASECAPDQREHAFRHLKEAVTKQGFDPARAQSEFLLTALRDDPRYQKQIRDLIPLPNAGQPTAGTVLVVDPIQD